MEGVGPSLGPQLMAEIGDVTHFTHRGAITAFVGVNQGVNESGDYEKKSVPTFKRGSSTLHRLCSKSWMFSSNQSQMT